MAALIVQLVRLSACVPLHSMGDCAEKLSKKKKRFKISVSVQHIHLFPHNVKYKVTLNRWRRLRVVRCTMVTSVE